jgi:hypothetical protein
MIQHALPNSLRISDTGCYEHSSDEVCMYDSGHVVDISNSVSFWCQTQKIRKLKKKKKTGGWKEEKSQKTTD